MFDEAAATITRLGAQLFPITSTTGVLAALCATCAVFFWLEQRTQWKFFHFAPPLVFIYLVPILMTTGGILPHASPVYTTMKSLLLPMLLVLLLVKMNLRGAVRILGPGLGVMLVGSVGVMIGAPVGLLVVRHWLQPDAWKAFGALSASWIGGTANLVAVAEMTHAKDEVGLAMFSDSVIAYLIWLPILLASKRYASRFARFSGVNVKEMNRLEEAVTEHVETKRATTTNEYLFLIATAVAATWVADISSQWIETKATAWFPPTAVVATPADGDQTQNAQSATAVLPPAKLQKSPFADASTWRILIVTTIGIALSFTRLNQVSGSQELAMALLYLFVTCMGATANLEKTTGQMLPFFIGSLIMIFIHGLFCLLGARIFRTDIHTAAIASAANIGGVATSSIVASYHKRSLLPAAVLMAIIGIAIGTYCGYITAQICRLIM